MKTAKLYGAEFFPDTVYNICTHFSNPGAVSWSFSTSHLLCSQIVEEIWKWQCHGVVMFAIEHVHSPINDCNIGSDE